MPQLRNHLLQVTNKWAEKIFVVEVRNLVVAANNKFEANIKLLGNVVITVCNIAFAI